MLTVIELQTTNGVTSTLSTAFNEESLALQKYYQILSFAAVSTVDIHAAMIITEFGVVNASMSFDHRTTEES